MSTYVTKDLPHFKFWCYKILPLVYDDSLSYYELLCKIYDYMNKMMEDMKSVISDIDDLKAEMEEIKDMIDKFDTEYIEKVVSEYLATMVKDVVFGLSTGGYFVAYIPTRWQGLEFGTIQDESTGLYGHLTLQYYDNSNDVDGTTI